MNEDDDGDTAATDNASGINGDVGEVDVGVTDMETVMAEGDCERYSTDSMSSAEDDHCGGHGTATTRDDGDDDDEEAEEEEEDDDDGGGGGPENRTTKKNGCPAGTNTTKSPPPDVIMHHNNGATRKSSRRGRRKRRPSVTVGEQTARAADGEAQPRETETIVSTVVPSTRINDDDSVAVTADDDDSDRSSAPTLQSQQVGRSPRFRIFRFSITSAINFFCILCNRSSGRRRLIYRCRTIRRPRALCRNRQRRR